MSMITRTPCDEAAIRAAAAERPCGPTAGRFVLAATILGSSMAFIDGTAVNVALPALQQSLGATAADVQWVVESYALFLAALLLVGGALGDRYGRRRLFGVGVVLFAAASVWCGLAPGVGQLIVARSAQGVGAALLVPGSLAIISASFDQEARGTAIGTWSGFTAITAALGPVLGGWLVDNASWRWVFFVNVPIALLVLVLLTRVPESRDEEAAALDLPGAVLATAGLGGVVFALIEAARLGPTSPAVLAGLVVGVAALAAFVRVEIRSAAPMLPPALFRSRTFSGANLMTFLLYAALGGALFFMPFQLIMVEGYSATAAGAALLPFILIMFVLSRWSGGLVARVGGRRPLIGGPLVAALGFALFASPVVDGATYWTTYFVPVVVLGIGMAITVAPLTTVVMEAVHVRHSGVASGVNNAVSRTGSLVAVAAMGLLMTAFFGAALESSVQAALGATPSELGPEVARDLLAQKDQWAAASVEGVAEGPTREAAQALVANAFEEGFRRIMWVAAGLAVLASLSAAGTIAPVARPAPAAERAPEVEPAAG